MRVPGITIDMMIAVIAMAQKKSLELAGRELGLTASAVHKRIQAANQVFETRLFASTTEGVQLTEVGEIFYSHALKAMEQLLLAEETTIAASALKESHLIVGHSTYLPSRLLALIHNLHFASTLSVHLEHKPGLTLGLAQDVVLGTLHAGLGYLPVAHPDLLVYTVAEEPVVVCMASTHPLAVRPVIRPKDLEGEPIIAIGRGSLPVLHQQIEDFFQDFGITLNIVADAFGPPEAAAMVEQRVGICLVAASHCKPAAVARPLFPQTLTRKWGLFVREDNRHPALKAFVDLVLERTARWRPAG